MKRAVIFGFLVFFFSAANSQNILEKQIFDSINTFRVENDLPILCWNEDLFTYAEEHSQYQATKKKANHDNFIVRVNKLGAIQENVGEYQTTERIVPSWTNSYHHKENLLYEGTTAAVAMVEVNGEIFVTFIVK